MVFLLSTGTQDPPSGWQTTRGGVVPFFSRRCALSAYERVARRCSHLVRLISFFLFHLLTTPFFLMYMTPSARPFVSHRLRHASPLRHLSRVFAPVVSPLCHASLSPCCTVFATRRTSSCLAPSPCVGPVALPRHVVSPIRELSLPLPLVEVMKVCCGEGMLDVAYVHSSLQDALLTRCTCAGIFGVCN